MLELLDTEQIPQTADTVIFLKSEEGLGLVANHQRSIRSGKAYDTIIPMPACGKPRCYSKTIIKEGASVFDTVPVMQKIVRDTLHQTKDLAKVLKGKNLLDTSRKIYDFIYHHIQYKLDTPGIEQLYEPSRIWHGERRSGVDCDDYTILASSLLMNMQIPHIMRMAKYYKQGIFGREPKPYFQHIYVVVPEGSKEIIIDPVKDKFNVEHGPIAEIKDYPMNPSGLGVLLPDDWAAPEGYERIDSKVTNRELTWLFSNLGSVAGIVYSVKHKTGFWKGVGNWFLGGMIAGGGSHLALTILRKNPVRKKKQEEVESPQIPDKSLIETLREGNFKNS